MRKQTSMCIVRIVQIKIQRYTFFAREKIYSVSVKNLKKFVCKQHILLFYWVLYSKLKGVESLFSLKHAAREEDSRAVFQRRKGRGSEK